MAKRTHTWIRSCFGRVVKYVGPFVRSAAVPLQGANIVLFAVGRIRCLLFSCPGGLLKKTGKIVGDTDNVRIFVLTKLLNRIVNK